MGRSTSEGSREEAAASSDKADIPNVWRHVPADVVQTSRRTSGISWLRKRESLVPTLPHSSLCIPLSVRSHKGFKKGKRSCIAVNGTPSHCNSVSLAIWDHAVFTATRHKWTHPALTLARQAGTRFTNPVGMEDWVDLGDRIYTEMVYPRVDGHPSKY